MKRVIICFLVLFTALFVGCSNKSYDENTNERVEGVPDCVISNISTSPGRCDANLTVIANRYKIEDKEDFAWEVIKMCQENSFKTMKFSTDLSGYPTSLDINVYLWEDERLETDPVMNIRFKASDTSQNYNIVDDAEQFQLFIDGQLIE